MAGDGRRQHRAQYVTAQKRSMLSRPPIRRDRSRDTAWTSGARIEADESVQPVALKETAGVAGKGKQARDDADVSRARPRMTAVAHAIKINCRERLAADCDRSSCRRIWPGRQFAGWRDEEAGGIARICRSLPQTIARCFRTRTSDRTAAARAPTSRKTRAFRSALEGPPA